MTKLDLTGQKYGRLTVLGFSHIHPKTQKTYWRAICDCGNMTIALGSGLKRLRPQSCGCLRVEELKRFNKRTKTKHGFGHNRFYRLWSGMIARCKYDKDYVSVVVCKEWADSFITFKNEMYSSYLAHVNECGEKDTTIDRIDNNKGYFKDNCRWVTRSEQGKNRRNVTLHFIDNRQDTVAGWAKKYGIRKHTVYGRMKKGWGLKEALETPLQRTRAI